MTSDKQDQHITQPLLSPFSPRKKHRGRGGGTYFKFWLIGGVLIRRGRLFEGGAYSRIYSMCYLWLQGDGSEEEKGVIVLRQYEDLEWLYHCLIAHNNVDGVVVS